ncbi:hypothetical protein J4423_01750 [Candidatus Pacearchaeota archaeon]|nr:hypothetical protein [Candidatus Pacearchaeota archaeon]
MGFKFYSLIIIFFMFSVVSAANLDVKVLEKNEVIITELDKTNATFKLNITNLESVDDEFQIYSLVSIGMYPKEFFAIKRGETITLEISAVPFKEILRDKRGIYAFEYQIKGKKTGFFKDTLAIKILDVKDAVSVSIEDIPLNATKTKLTVINKEDINIKNLKIITKSDFFEFSKTFDLGKKESKVLDIPIILEDRVSAGEYDVEIIYELNNKKSSSALILQYLEASGISVFENTEGFIVKKTEIRKTNEGNVPALAKISIRKNILTRLFTIYSDKPVIQRSGVFVDYSWEKEIGVGESYTVNVTTNYTFPFIIILLVVIVGFFVSFLATGKLSVHKGVSFVRTRGGEFALKINLRVKARSNLKNIVISDRIPGHAKLFNKFGIPPHRIDEHSRKIEWDINQLNAGEERVFSYIIYSKINIVGSFELPAASVSFEHDGKRQHTLSNKTHFAAETTEN